MIARQRQNYEDTMHACLCAVRDGFPHLAMSDIIDPPADMFDAALARQVVIYLMASEFKWPQRVVARLEERSLSTIQHAVKTIKRRLEHPRFARHYQFIRTQAHAFVTLLLNPDFRDDEAA